MKIKHLLMPLVILGFLTGCEEGEKEVLIEDVQTEDSEDSNLTTQTPVVTPTPTYTETNDTSTEEEDTYSATIERALSMNVELITEILTYYEMYVENQSIAQQDKEYLNNLNEPVLKLALLEAVLIDMKSSNDVPNKFSNTHDSLLKMVRLEIEGFTNIVDGVALNDVSRINVGNEMIVESIDAMVTYKKEVAEIQN